MMNIILIGAPGSGKGTQASKLVAECGMVHLSTGEMLRAAIAAKTPVGLLIGELINSGSFVSDNIVSGIIDERLSEIPSGTGVIFDGYPRTIDQALSLDRILENNGRSLDHIIELMADDDVIIQRISGRYSCSACNAGYHKTFNPPKNVLSCDKCSGTEFEVREDDKEEFVRNRMERFRNNTLPVIEFYKDRGNVKIVNGMDHHSIVSKTILGHIM